MTRLLIAVAVALVLLPVGAAHAETTAPSPSPSPTGGSTTPSTAADPFVRAFDGEVRELTFPEANLDGSFVDSGKQFTLAADLFFAYNKATLSAKAASVLDEVAARLMSRQAATVRVAGYTDSRGSASYNLGLSNRRAIAVRDALAKRLPGVRFKVRAFGEQRPVATNTTDKGRAANRRVTITVTG